MSANRFHIPITPVTKNLIIINVIIWGAMMIQPDRIGDKIEQFGALYYWGSEFFNPAQLFTYMFLHSTSNLTHLFFNMFTLWMFGTSIEMLVGSRRFLFYYIACGVGAALIQEIVYTFIIHHEMQYIPEGGMESLRLYGATALKHYQNFSDPYLAHINILTNIPTVGASGAIYGILLAFGMFFPNRPLFIMFLPIPIKAKYMVVFWGLAELVLAFAGRGDSVAHICHLGGMLAGLLIILYWKHKKIVGGPYF